MRVSLIVVGRLRSGPEKALIDDYLTRFDRTGRAHGLGPARVIEVEDKRGGGPKAEAALLLAAIPADAHVIALDERGRELASETFAATLQDIADDGKRELAFVIGGADGLSPDIRASANFQLSFGKMVWPHMLVRVMLAEQLYRAASILARSPYHRA